MITDILWVIGIIIVLVWLVLSVRWYLKIRHYQKAKVKIFNYVKTYKGKCTGLNRFIVSEVELQNIFREYDIDLIEEIFQELINHRIIERDPIDQEWCVR